MTCWRQTLTDGVVIIDDSGVIRQVMTSALDAKELSENVVEAVAAMKTDKVGDIFLY